jgi:adenylate cyclase
MVTRRTLATGLSAAVLAVGLSLVGTLETAELMAFDRLFELRGELPAATPIVIVAIDEDSFDELDLPWPFPRALHGQLIDLISAGRPVAIAFDVVFPEPSPRGPADDEALGAAVARAGNVVLAAAITRVQDPFYSKEDLNIPVASIRRGAAAVAPVNEVKDADGYIRRAALRSPLGDDRLPSWDVALHQLLKKAGVDVAPLPPGDELIINYRGRPRTFPWVPYHRVIQGEVGPEAFEGTVVLVGATSPVLQDIVSTPFARAREMPGVEVHANVVDTLVRGDAIRPVPPWVSLVAAALVAVAAAALVAWLGPVRAVLAVGLLGAVVAGATFILFAHAQVWFQAVGVTLALGLGYGGTVLDRYVMEQRERRQLAQFFSPAVLREVVQSRGQALTSRRRLVTVLFSDIRGFTSLSERVEPEQVAEMLREYLTEMTEVVFRYGGTVDKYIGDCIMALYNAPVDDPDHAAKAIRTGLEFLERTAGVSARWESRLGVRIRAGVGINTGEAVVGTMGSRQRLEYTAIGDTVNLASRLEGLTKVHGAGIIISETTLQRVRDCFLTRELGEVAVRGRTTPVKIYAVVPADLRKYPRTALEAAANVVAVGDHRTCAVRTRDLSEGGLALEGLPPEWGPGTAVEIRCEGGGLPRPLAAEGTIVWRRGDLGGIAFAALEPEAVPSAAKVGGRMRR